MSKVHCELLPKEIYFLIRALKAQIDDFNRKIADENTDEDEISDMNNDLILMVETLEYLQSIEK